MNFKNKKGVSDVVTTVLIILLVLAAVAIVGSIVLRQTTEAGKKIDRGVVCLTNKVEPVSCKIIVVAGNPAANVAGTRSTTNEVSSISSLGISVQREDGSVATTTTGTPTLVSSLVNGATGYATVTGGTAASNPKKATITAVFTLPDTSTISCPSQPIDCTA